MVDLHGIPVVVTGAGGWLGQAALEIAHQSGAEIHAFGSRPREHRFLDGTTVSVLPLSSLDMQELSGALVLHMAFLTREHAARMDEADYIAANRTISEFVAGFIKRNGARGVFVPSSGAVYAPPPNPYGVCKLEDEGRFTMLGSMLSIPTVIIRIFNLAGPFINKQKSYVLSCILNDLLAGRPVTLNAAHPVWRGYAHVNDVLNVALGLLLAGHSPLVFDSWGEPVEISALAARAAQVAQRELVLQRPEWRNGASDYYMGDEKAYLSHTASLNLTPSALEKQIRDTMVYLTITAT
ncbi:NAD-dependent epimerase/dehydratase family protein [Acidocella sp.]|uniref:NAD-dependent epimerase/dehydratase family protein n=1 Tax=Acidocella sp. TaxID=50710 RepID=UPI003CFC7590